MSLRRLIRIVRRWLLLAVLTVALITVGLFVYRFLFSYTSVSYTHLTLPTKRIV